MEQQLGLTEVLWDVDSQDWNGASTAAIVQAAGRLQNGQVIFNGSASWSSGGNVMTVLPNGSGNTFGLTVQHGGNRNWPSVSCRTG